MKTNSDYCAAEEKKCMFLSTMLVIQLTAVTNALR